MKLKIIMIINVITIIICVILTGLYFVGNPGGVYVKSGGFIPTFEYTSAMNNYMNWGDTFENQITVTTTDRSVDVCVGSNAGYDKDIVMGNYKNLETVQFSIEELNNMASITINDVVYLINDGTFMAEGIINAYTNSSPSLAGASTDAAANVTYYFAPSSPTELYTAQYIDTTLKNLDPEYYVNGFFTVSSESETHITMVENIDDANLDEHIQIIVPFQIEETCTTVEPNSTYVIDSTGGGHYE